MKDNLRVLAKKMDCNDSVYMTKSEILKRKHFDKERKEAEKKKQLLYPLNMRAPTITPEFEL